MDDFEIANPEKSNAGSFNGDRLFEDDKIWVPLMIGLIFGAASKKWDDPEDKKDNIPN